MAQDCCENSNNIMILACSGGSNVGQMANQVAVELTKEGFGKMFCLAGIGGHLSGFVKSAGDAPMIVALDGCSLGCAKAILNHLDIKPAKYMVLTDLGFEKNKNFDLKLKDIERIKTAVKSQSVQPQNK